MKKHAVVSSLMILAAILLSAGSPVTPKAGANNTEDTVLQWNRVVWSTVALPGLHPATVHNSRSIAMVHLAMFDAVNSIDGSYKPYLTEVPGSKNASPDAAAAQAARDVLTALYPSRQSVFDAELAISLAGIEANRAAQGRTVGSIVAANILASRSDDGWATEPPAYELSTAPGNWQRTPPGFAAAALTNFSLARPFATTGSTQFLPNPPPSISSDLYAADFNEAKSLGALDSVTRTADQTQIALVWASGAASSVAWNNVARNAATNQGNTLVQNARLFALLSMVQHDCLQTTFTSKYHYGLWRPITAIRRADEDGNPATEADPAWNSLVVSPPYPTYAGNAAGAGTGQATILAQFFGRDDISTAIGFSSPAAIRSYPGFAAIANEMARSRVFAGIHFNFDNEAGQSVGRNVANYAYANHLTPRTANGNGQQR